MATLQTPVNIVVEGAVDNVVMQRLLKYVGLRIGRCLIEGGNRKLIDNLHKRNAAGHFAPWLVVIDLDDNECAPAFIRTLLPIEQYNSQFRLRVAVREIEAWLLADREALAQFLRISINLVPRNPDAEDDPKQVLVNLARRSRNKQLVADIVPRPESGRRVGPGYLGRITEYI
ncbi:MAG: hypothetical protein CUN54_08760, partial [Phototrophicales bacterium]